MIQLSRLGPHQLLYQKIIVALTGTDRIMQGIDKVGLK